MILHHYGMSPFSEKIRIMLAYSGLDWRSAISPAMPPRPIVDPLAGGYRRIPIAQVGADVFCDTRIISAEIAQQSGKAELAMENCDPEVQQFVRHVDSQVFMAIPLVSSPLNTIVTLFTAFPPLQAIRFIKDRMQIAKSMKMKRISRFRAQALLDENGADLEARLAAQPFLFGEQPNIADFSAYHVIWFRVNMQGAAFLSELPNTKQWYERMVAMRGRPRTELNKEAVFAEASKNSPRRIPKAMQQDSLIGQQVEIRPTDYAQNSVVGKLVGANDLRWIIARETAEFGLLHVHFPRADFEINCLK